MKQSQMIEVAAIAVLFFCALAYLVTPLLPKSETSAMKVVELVIAASASIGTALAAMVALHFGLGSQQAQSHKDLVAAEIVAVRLMVKLSPIVAALKVFEVVRVRDTSQEFQLRCCQVCSSHIAAGWFALDPAETLALAPLGRRLPQKLTFIFEKLRTLPNDIDDDAKWIARTEDSKKENLDCWTNTFTLCRRELVKLSHVLSDAGIKELDAPE